MFRETQPSRWSPAFRFPLASRSEELEVSSSRAGAESGAGYLTDAEPSCWPFSGWGCVCSRSAGRTLCDEDLWRGISLEVQTVCGDVDVYSDMDVNVGVVVKEEWTGYGI